MILVSKGDQPDFLAKAAGPATNKLTQAFEAGATVPKASKSKYGHKSVRQALSRAQFGKCCYCEVKIPKPYAYENVEHFRPKSQSRQDDNSPENRPGYYWLAYDWENLFLSCGHCNSTYKQDLFPLADDNLRARSHHDDIAQEAPLILNPSGPEDPRDHIDFHDDMPKPLTELGRRTIEVVGLDCKEREDRLEYLNELKYLRNQIIDFLFDEPTPSSRKLIQDNRARLLVAQRPTEKYSSMVRAFLHENPMP